MSKKKRRKFIVSILLLSVIAGGVFYIYQKFFTAVHLKDRNYIYVYIKRSSTFTDVVNEIYDLGIVDSEESFEWLAKKMNLDEEIHPGRYRITNGMTMRQIINLLKYNKQEKVKLSYNSQIHDLEEFISYTDEKLEMTSDEIEDFLTDEKKLKDLFGLDPENALGLIVPGTYEVSWSVSTDELFSLLSGRFHEVWTPSRIGQAKRLGFTVPEVITIASIIQSESSIRSEQEKIAGVYINRLKADMLLQADPTLKYANKNYETQRILDVDKEINSPYNTYRYKGLPPGPICLVNQQAIDAALNYQKHNYIFFCAKPQLNGYSDYSTTYSQHMKYAAAYQKALDKMGISR